MAFWKKENKLDTFVVFDIGSASVGAALVSYADNKKVPKILYNTRVPIVLQESLVYEKFFIAMQSALKSAAYDVEQNGIRKLESSTVYKKDISSVFCILSSSWCVANIDKIKVKEHYFFFVSPELISTILEKENSRFKNILKDGIDKKNIVNPVIIEEKIIQILLNGYSTNKPYGRKVKHIDATLFMSAVSIDVKKNITDILEKIFSTANISFGTFTLASFSVIRDVFNTEKNFLTIDISGEVVDIFLVRNETMIKMDSFSFGKNFLIRKIAFALNSTLEEAHSSIKLFLEGKSTGEESKKVGEALMNTKEEWLARFRKIMADFAEEISLPKTVFLTADIDVSKWFVEAIQNDAFSSDTLAEQPFTVVELNSKILDGSSEAVSGLDPFLVIEALFFHKTHTTKDV